MLYNDWWWSSNPWPPLLSLWWLGWQDWPFLWKQAIPSDCRPAFSAFLWPDHSRAQFLSLFLLAGKSQSLAQSPGLRLWVLSSPVRLNSQVLPPPPEISPVGQLTLQSFQKWEHRLTSFVCPFIHSSGPHPRHPYFQLLSQAFKLFFFLIQCTKKKNKNRKSPLEAKQGIFQW